MVDWVCPGCNKRITSGDLDAQQVVADKTGRWWHYPCAAEADDTDD
jgi:hypothetical protein